MDMRSGRREEREKERHEEGRVGEGGRREGEEAESERGRNFHLIQVYKNCLLVDSSSTADPVRTHMVRSVGNCQEVSI